jgi:hypothetical protein
MSLRDPRNLRILIIICIVAGAVAAMAVYLLSPQQIVKRQEQRQAARYHRRFVARFDSLCKAQLYPVVWRSGTFLTTEFDEERRTWTLTLSSTDWARRDGGSKKDLAAKLLTSFRAVRAQAGGDPDEAALVIADEAGEEMVEASASGGTTIYK